MKQSLRRQLNREKRKIDRRQRAARNGMPPKAGPELSTRTVQCEVASRARAVDCGGIGVLHQLVKSVRLEKRLNELRVIRQPKPYRDSDHILNIAYNILCGGRTLDDIEYRRQDSAFLDALGARMIPDPTTAGDYCRRYDADSVDRLMDAINEVRTEIWRRQPPDFLRETARIDADGSLVETTGECKQGMDINYKGQWGYHPLLISLANTGEPLYLVNRSGNRPSSEGAETMFDRAIGLCRSAGFSDVLLRGDTDFSLTRHFDRWTEQGVRFVFGYDASKGLVGRAEGLLPKDYRKLERPQRVVAEEHRRTKPKRVKQEIVVEREYKNIRLESEEIAEFRHKPTRASQTYRMVVVRKNLVEERGQRCLDFNVRYFFYVTNDWDISAEQVVREANQRCNQENLIEQLKNSVRSLHAPLNALNANSAYMVIASLAWTLKAWMALLTPISPRWRHQHEQIREHLLRIEFRRFIRELIFIPAQIIRSARRVTVRFLAAPTHLRTLLRLHHDL